MLEIGEDVMLLQVIHDVGYQYMFQDFARERASEEGGREVTETMRQRHRGREWGKE
jgi:hypothetical protein